MALQQHPNPLGATIYSNGDSCCFFCLVGPLPSKCQVVTWFFCYEFSRAFYLESLRNCIKYFCSLEAGSLAGCLYARACVDVDDGPA